MPEWVFVESLDSKMTQNFQFNQIPEWIFIESSDSKVILQSNRNHPENKEQITKIIPKHQFSLTTQFTTLQSRKQQNKLRF